jgi:hypothetical protein
LDKLLNIIKPFYYIIGHFGWFCIGFLDYKGLTNRGLDGIMQGLDMMV